MLVADAIAGSVTLQEFCNNFEALAHIITLCVYMLHCTWSELAEILLLIKEC